METEKFILWSFTSLTRIKFLIICNIYCKDGPNKLKSINEFYAEITGKGPMYIVKILIKFYFKIFKNIIWFYLKIFSNKFKIKFISELCKKYYFYWNKYSFLLLIFQIYVNVIKYKIMVLK